VTNIGVGIFNAAGKTNSAYNRMNRRNEAMRRLRIGRRGRNGGIEISDEDDGGVVLEEIHEMGVGPRRRENDNISRSSIPLPPRGDDLAVRDPGLSESSWSSSEGSRRVGRRGRSLEGMQIPSAPRLRAERARSAESRQNRPNNNVHNRVNRPVLVQVPPIRNGDN
jgi:hypothetical protein